MNGWTRVLAKTALCLTLPGLLFTACERPETRRANQIMRLVRGMEADLQAEAAKAAAAFAGRPDFEELRQSFGSDHFDGGIPMAPDFPGILVTMIRELEAQMEKDPKDAEFPRKAARRIRQLSQWWAFVRKHLEERRDVLAKAPAESEARRLVGGRTLRADVLTVISETIVLVGTFEATTLRCVRAIEAIVTQS